MKGKIFASFLTVSILFGLIIVSIQFVNAGNVRTISIDGNIADWAGISPSATADDSAVDSRNYQAIYLANDQNNLYLRFDTVPFADFHNVTFGIDTDLNWNTLNPISGQNGSAPNELFLLYHSHYGDAAMVAYANFMWQFCSYSPIENNWLCLASDANQNGIQFACSDGEIEIAIPLSSLGIRNPLNQIWIAFPFAQANWGANVPNAYLIYDIDRQATVVSMLVSRYTGKPITYSDSFEADNGRQYILNIGNTNLTSLSVKINDQKILEVANGNTAYSGIIPSQYLEYGQENTITVVPTGQPNTSAQVQIEIK